MKTKIRLSILPLGILLLAGILILFSCKKEEHAGREMDRAEQHKTGEREILYYTCGMHPTVRVSPEDHAAGNVSCPICKMDLVPVYKEDKASTGMEGEEHEGHDKLESLLQLSARA